jgi:hypothetical protein
MNSHPDTECGRVLLFTGGDPIAAVVKWQSRSHYSHAALLIPGTNRVIESYPFNGVRERELTAKDWERIHAYEVAGMTPLQWEGAVQFCTSQLGMPYDWRSVFKFMTRTPAKENGKWFCSELVFKAIEKHHLRLLQMSAEYVNPGHLGASPYLRRDTEFEMDMAEALSADFAD